MAPTPMTGAQHPPGNRPPPAPAAPKRPDDALVADGKRPRPDVRRLSALPRAAAHLAIRAYQLTLSGLVGRQCRHMPTCSHYTDEAIATFGLWAGGWIGLARICRCHPLGSSGFDPVPQATPATARWYLPWRYGRWRLREADARRPTPEW